MLDIKFIRENPKVIKGGLKRRNDQEKLKWVDDLIKKEEEYRKLSHQLQLFRQRRNQLTDEVRELKKQGKDASKILKEIQGLPDVINEAEARVNEVKTKIDFYMERLPNILHESVPVGKDFNDSVVVRKVGNIPKFNFKVKSHVDIIKDLDLADTERAANVAGSRFYYLKNELVMLDLALQTYALEFLIKKGYTPMEVPLMINKKAISGAVTISDFEDVIYKIEDEDLYMIATSEHSLACYHMDETIDDNALPLRYAGLSSCFRKEAGSHGKDTKGIFRVHQFNKIEQFIFCKQEESWKLHEELLKNSEELFKKLKLPYRVINVCTGDIGAVAAKKYDIDVWMPAQQHYREVVSCSNCTEYQSRKLNIKYGKEGGEKQLVHTLNSTAIATTRAMVAIMENFQQKDGTIKIPAVLQPYMNGLKVIGKK